MKHMFNYGPCIVTGRLIWMIPPADQPSSQDAHVPVANPDDHQEPSEDSDPSSHTKPQTDSSPPTLGIAAGGNGSFHRIGFVDDENADGVEAQAKKGWQPQPILLDVQKECFSRMLLLPDMITDHLPETYLAAVQQL